MEVATLVVDARRRYRAEAKPGDAAPVIASTTVNAGQLCRRSWRITPAVALVVQLANRLDCDRSRRPATRTVAARNMVNGVLVWSLRHLGTTVGAADRHMDGRPCVC